MVRPWHDDVGDRRQRRPGPDDAARADPNAAAARIDQQMEDAEGGIEGSLLDAPDTDTGADTVHQPVGIGTIGRRTNVSSGR